MTLQEIKQSIMNPLFVDTEKLERSIRTRPIPQPPDDVVKRIANSLTWDDATFKTYGTLLRIAILSHAAYLASTYNPNSMQSDDHVNMLSALDGGYKRWVDNKRILEKLNGYVKFMKGEKTI